MRKPPIKQKYFTPEEVLQAWEEYKAFIKNNPDTMEEVTPRGIVTKSVVKPLTQDGFYAYFFRTRGHHVKQYIDNQDGGYESYLEIVNYIKSEWRDDQISGTMTGKYKSSTLVARINGLTEKTETQSNNLNTNKIIIEEVKRTPSLPEGSGGNTEQS